MMFVLGSIYRRRDIHQLYGGQQQGGICTPAGQNYIILFTSESGEAYGYRDGWSDDGLFLYTGEGQHGDMTLTRGNRSIRDHIADGKDLHLFEYIKTGFVRYVGQMIYTGYYEQRGPDIDGKDRRIIVFVLAPIDAFDTTVALPDDKQEEELWHYSLDELRKRATTAASANKAPKQTHAMARSRSNAIKIYVLKRANGVCEGCGAKAPFRSTTGRPYLETHHIRRLSDGGPDDPLWVIALCPNCHREAHYGEHYDDIKKRLTRIVQDIET